jgi:putative transposase
MEVGEGAPLFAQDTTLYARSKEVDGCSFKNIEEARRSIAIFIDTIYNTEHLHSALGYRPLTQFEATFALAKNS